MIISTDCFQHMYSLFIEMKEVKRMQSQRNAISGFLKLYLLAASAFIFLSFSVMGCSGGGGDGGGSGGSQNANDLLDGTYSFDLFAESNGADFWNQSDAMIFDGSGGFSLTTAYDSTGDSGSLSGTYTVDTNGGLTVTGTDHKGQTTADGTLFVTTDTNPDDTDGDISLAAGLKSGSSMDASSLNGSYTICQIRNDGDTKASRLSFTFDGAGTLSGEILEDTDGSTGTLSGTYTVAANGALGMVVTGISKTFAGNVSADGNIFLVYDTDDDGEVLLMVGLKKAASGMSASNLSGDYQMNMIAGSATSTWTQRIAMSADGAGTMSIDILAASDDDLSDQPDMNYSVAGDGTLTITGTDLVGQLSSDGEILVLVDSDTSSDGEVILTIGIKKS